jgi:hypothetical protein
MELEVSPEAINKYMADRIIESAIGAELQKVIKEAVDKITTGYDSPIKKLVDQHVQQLHPRHS